MNEGGRLVELEDVFDALVASGESPEPAVLDRWLRDYPQFESELVGFMSSWILMDAAMSRDRENLPEAGIESRESDAFVLRGMSIVQNLLHQIPRPEASRPLQSLLGATKAAGMTLKDVSRSVHLGDVVLRKLDRRLVRFASIPKEAIVAIAGALRCSVEAISEYLQRPPTFAAGAQYRASSTPQLAEPEDFMTAVQQDPTISTDDRARWLGTRSGDP